MISTEDKIAIGELVARFCHYSDFGEWEKLASLYTPDIVTEMDGIPFGYEGIEQQVAHARESDLRTEGCNRHYCFNLVVEDDGEGGAVANYMFMNVNAGKQRLEARIVVTGRHVDRVVKVDGEWKFKRRRVIFDQSFDLDF